MKKTCKSGHVLIGNSAVLALFCPYCGLELSESSDPIEIDVYAHGYEDVLRDKGENIGLTGAALDTFSHCLNELELTVQVDPKTGKTNIIAVDDVPLDRENFI